MTLVSFPVKSKVTATNSLSIKNPVGSCLIMTDK